MCLKPRSNPAASVLHFPDIRQPPLPVRFFLLSLQCMICFLLYCIVERFKAQCLQTKHWSVFLHFSNEIWAHAKGATCWIYKHQVVSQHICKQMNAHISITYRTALSTCHTSFSFQKINCNQTRRLYDPSCGEQVTSTSLCISHQHISSEGHPDINPCFRISVPLDLTSFLQKKHVCVRFYSFFIHVNIIHWTFNVFNV